MSNAIVQLLHPDSVLLNCEFASSEEVIKAIGKKLFKAGFVKESFINAAIEREKNLPTGLPLGGGINAAIPLYMHLYSRFEFCMPNISLAIFIKENN